MTLDNEQITSGTKFGSYTGNSGLNAFHGYLKEKYLHLAVRSHLHRRLPAYEHA